MTVSEMYYNLMGVLDELMSLQFTFLDINFTLWGLFLTSSFLTFIGTILFTGIYKDYSV